MKRIVAFLRSFGFHLLPLVFSLSACSPTYVLRAGYEEARILWRRQPIEDMLQRADLDADTRAKLELVLAVRAFAADALHLRVDGSFASFARVDANQVVYVVSAAYRTRLEPYTWWFPIVGRVPYKGFFSKSSAEAEAACLEREGYDTSTRPSAAFSTLGWFADPLLSNLLRYDRVTLANIIIHELLHNTIYVGGHADFDESFANFVGTRGAMLFFATRHEVPALQQATASWDDTLLFSDFIGRFTTHLRATYAFGIDPSERERVFSEAQEDFRHLPFHTALYADFGTRRLNNAVILQYLMYADRLAEFDALLQQERGDLNRTIEAVIAAVKSGGDPFAAIEKLTRTQTDVPGSGSTYQRTSSRLSREFIPPVSRHLLRLRDDRRFPQVLRTLRDDRESARLCSFDLFAGVASRPHCIDLCPAPGPHFAHGLPARSRVGTVMKLLANPCRSRPTFLGYALDAPAPLRCCLGTC